jgi:hypothetical protein
MAEEQAGKRERYRKMIGKFSRLLPHGKVKAVRDYFPSLIEITCSAELLENAFASKITQQIS